MEVCDSMNGEIDSGWLSTLRELAGCYLGILSKSIELEGEKCLCHPIALMLLTMDNCILSLPKWGDKDDSTLKNQEKI